MSKSISYEALKAFKKKYPFTVAWRIKSHARIIDMHLNSNEEILYAFLGQKNDNMLDFTSTYAVVLTNERIMLATKRVVFGYNFKSITPDLYNDLTVNKCILWGRIVIDTIKEKIILTDIAPSALPEIETKISEYMMEAKKKYKGSEKSVN